MSEINVNTIDKATGSTLNVGAAGTTVNIAGTAGTGFPAGVSLTGSTNNTVATVTGANALAGETNFIYNGTIVGAGADGANADLGEGIHVKTSDIGSVTVDANGKGLVIEKNGSTGLSIITPNNQSGNIFFGDPEEGSQGQIYYSHNDDSMHFKTGATEKLHLTNAGSIFFPQASQGVYLGVTSVTAANLLDDYEEGTWTPNWSTTSGGSVSGASTNIANYVKVGNQVTVSMYAAIQSSGTFTDFIITNLPFTQLVNGAGNAVEIGQTGTAWLIQGAAGGGTFYMKQYNAGIANNPTVQICYTYVTS